MSELVGGNSLNTRFKLIRPLGKGGMAHVWLVRDLELDEEMVAKILPPNASDELVALLRRECQQARRLVHPNIPRVFDFHRGDSGHHFISMVHVDGEDLGRFRGRAPNEILSLAIPIADALAYSHRMGVVHRDVKVSNVIVDAGQRPQLIDFGIAGLLGEGVSTEPESPELTEPDSGEEIRSRGGGSRYNVGPQQLAGQEPQPDDDVYAFGVLLYELISGHPPFWPEITSHKIQSEIPEPLQSVHPLPRRFQDLVVSMLEKFPAQRPASMEAVKAELAAIADEITGTSGAEVGTGVAATDIGAEAGPDTDEETTPPAASLTPPPRVQTIQPIPPRPDLGAPATPNAGIGAESVGPRPKRWSRTNVAIFAILGLVAIQVFVLLPDWLEKADSGTDSQAPVVSSSGSSTAVPEVERATDSRQREGDAPGTVSTAPLSSTGSFSAEELRDRAYLEQQAGEALARAKGLQHALEAAGVSIWGAQEYALAAGHLTTGDRGVKTGDYATAAIQYREASRLLQGLEARAPSVLQQVLADGGQALAAGEATSAAAAFALALQLAPDNQVASRGLRSAENLVEVQTLMAAGAQAEHDGDLRAAESSYKSAVALDPVSRPAREALARVRARSRDESFGGFMTQGLAALGRADFSSARQAFARAGKIRPDAPQVAEAVARVVEAEKSAHIAKRQGWAVRLEELERWRSAAAQYDTVLQVDPTLVFAQEGKSRALARAELAAKIAYHLGHPGRLSANAVLEEALELAQEAALVEVAGARHRQQLEQFEKLLETMGQPVLVILESDGQTEVAVYQVGRLGTFVRHELELRPGTYTVVGQLKGYRDVRLKLVVKPGHQPPPLPVRCEERI